jgi:PAS domain S-box-containing protein
MAKRNQSPQQVSDETIDLKSRLEETEETLRAIREYMVDAFVVTRSNGAQVVTLSNADFPYRMMVESMNEGAVTLIPDGTIFYCNPRFGEMVQVDPEKLVGIRFRDLIRSEEQSAFDALFNEAEHGARAEFCLQPPTGNCLPVQLSIYQLSAGDTGGISIIATDITERVQAEEKIRNLASQLTMAEQQERQRISQVLHDDLQQRLFAIKTQLTILTNDNENNGLSPTANADLRQVQRWLSDAIGVTRSLSIDLGPMVLQGEGLSESLLWLASQMKVQHGLQIQLESKENLHALDSQMRLMLFQSIRELLFNIVKHAGTSEAEITLEQANEKARITISDSGKGFDVGAVMNDSKTAHGLLVVQDRLNLLGCIMEITSEPGKGTRVVIEAPLGQSSV